VSERAEERPTDRIIRNFTVTAPVIELADVMNMRTKTTNKLHSIYKF
jgi:hypothetical protein